VPDPAYRALAEAALEVARRRADLLDEVRQALINDDERRALALMRRYVGIEEVHHEGTGDCDRPGVH